jgi:hypothetical protein
MIDDRGGRLDNSCDVDNNNASFAAASELSALLSRARKRGSPRPLRSALLALGLTDVCVASFSYILGIAFTLANPVIIYLFIAWVHEASPTNWQRGAILCVALGATNACTFLCEAVFYARMRRAGLRARLGAAALVFRALGARKAGPAPSAGSAHNLYGTDAAAVAELPAAAAKLLLAPLELGAIVAMLAYFVGAGAGGALLAVGASVAIVIAAGARAMALDG